MSSSSSTKETSLYDKIKLKPTIQNTNINHGLISRGKYGIRTAEGTASYNQNLINISKEGTMQWKDYEKEIAQREEIRLGLRKVRESYIEPFSNPILLQGKNPPTMNQLVSFADEAMNNLHHQQQAVNFNTITSSPPNVNNWTTTNLNSINNTNNNRMIPLTTPSNNNNNNTNNNMHRNKSLSPTETIALVAAAAAEAALQASPYNTQLKIVDKEAYTTVATAAATAAASAYLGRNRHQALRQQLTSSTTNTNMINNNNNKLQINTAINNSNNKSISRIIDNSLENAENILPSPLMTMQESTVNNISGNGMINNNSNNSIIMNKKQQFYTNNNSLNISFSKSLASSRSSGMDSIRRRRRFQSGGGGAGNSNLSNSNNHTNRFKNSRNNEDIIPSPTSSDHNNNNSNSNNEKSIYLNNNFKFKLSPTTTTNGNRNNRTTPNNPTSIIGSSYNKNNNNMLEKGVGIVVRDNVYNNGGNNSSPTNHHSTSKKPFKIQLTPGKIKEISPSNSNEKRLEIGSDNDNDDDDDNNHNLFFRKTGILTYDHSPPRSKKRNNDINNILNDKVKANTKTPLKHGIASNAQAKSLKNRLQNLKGVGSTPRSGTPRSTKNDRPRSILKSTPSGNMNNINSTASPFLQSGSGLSGEDLGGLSFTPSKNMENDDEEYHPDDLAVLKAIEQADRYTPIAPNKKIGKLKGNLAGYKSTDRKQKQWERRYSQLQQMSYSPAGKS